MGAVILQVSYKSRKEKPIVFPSRVFSKMERNYFFGEKGSRYYLKDNYISQMLVWGKKKKKKLDHKLLVKIWCPKSSGSSQDAEMGFDLSCVSIRHQMRTSRGTRYH